MAQPPAKKKLQKEEVSFQLSAKQMRHCSRGIFHMQMDATPG